MGILQDREVEATWIRGFFESFVVIFFINFLFLYHRTDYRSSLFKRVKGKANCKTLLFYISLV